VCAVLCQDGELHLDQSRLDLARASFQESLELGKEAGTQEYIATAKYGMARVASAKGNMPEAHLLGQESLEIFESIGHAKASEVRGWLKNLPPHPHVSPS
jgi:ATP/maltotriose-dependent transcriptional regulator MalT